MTELASSPPRHIWEDNIKKMFEIYGEEIRR
jgi:hypothetical protein